MFAAQCLRQPVSLHSFTELHNSAAQHTEARYNARHLGPTETAQFGEDPVDMATVTFECAPYTPSGLQRFGDDKRAIQAVHSATALVNMAPKVFVLENVKEFYTEDSHPRHGVYSKFVRSMAVRGYELSPPPMLMDSQSGGCIYRTRMFIFGEESRPHMVCPRGYCIHQTWPHCAQRTCCNPCRIFSCQRYRCMARTQEKGQSAAPLVATYQ